MKHLLITTIAAVVLVGCGESVPDISIHDAIVLGGDIEAVKQHLAAGTDVDAKDMNGETPLTWAAYSGHKEIAELLLANGLHFANLQSRLGYVFDWNCGESFEPGAGRPLLSMRLSAITSQINPRSQECSHRPCRVDLNNTDKVDRARCWPR